MQQLAGRRSQLFYLRIAPQPVVQLFIVIKVLIHEQKKQLFFLSVHLFNFLPLYRSRSEKEHLRR
jgi:hypothetical protein